MKIDILKHTIMNTVKSVTFGMKKPDVKFFRTALESVLEYRTTVLSKLGNSDEKPAKQLKNYYSRHLGKEVWGNLGEKVEKIMVRCIGKINREENCFCFDTVDTNKNSAEKMEGLKRVRDGSTGTLGNGFTWHGVSIKGIPLFFQRERIKEKEDTSLKYEIFEKQIEKIITIFGSGYWILADRGYDDYKKYTLLIKHNFFFSIRLKTNRNLEIIEGKGAGNIVKSGDLEEGNYTVKIAEIDSYLYVFVKTLPGLTNSIRVISNVNQEKNIERYLGRWEIERIFKTGKQEFDFEKVETKAIQKTENLVYLIQLCPGISAYIYHKMEPRFEFGQEKNDTISFEKMYKKISPFLKKRGLTFNRNSITSFIAYYMKYIKKMKSYFGQATLKPGFSGQLRLCESMFLKKVMPF